MRDAVMDAMRFDRWPAVLESGREVLLEDAALAARDAGPRYERALNLRRSGLTLAQVGEALNVGQERARAMLCKIARRATFKSYSARDVQDLFYV